MKVYITNEAKVAYSINWPDEPQVMASANADAITYSLFRKRIKELMQTPVWVKRPNELIVKILKTEGMVATEVLIDVDVKFTVTQDNGEYFVEWYDIPSEP